MFKVNTIFVEILKSLSFSWIKKAISTRSLKVQRKVLFCYTKSEVRSRNRWGQGVIFANGFIKNASNVNYILERENKQTKFNIKLKSPGPIDCNIFWTR